MDDITEAAEDCAFQQTVPETVGAHSLKVEEAMKTCLASLESTRADVNQSIDEAKDWVTTHFTQLRDSLRGDADNFRENSPPVLEMRLSLSTAELNSRALQMMQAISQHRRRSQELLVSAARTATVVAKREQLMLEVLPAVAREVGERVALLLRPLQEAVEEVEEVEEIEEPQEVQRIQELHGPQELQELHEPQELQRREEAEPAGLHE